MWRKRCQTSVGWVFKNVLLMDDAAAAAAAVLVIGCCKRVGCKMLKPILTIQQEDAKRPAGQEGTDRHHRWSSGPSDCFALAGGLADIKTASSSEHAALYSGVTHTSRKPAQPGRQ